MKKPLIRVSDHALIRFMERVMGVDCERIRREFGARLDAVYVEGACGIILDGYSCRIALDLDGAPIVTTVLDGTMGTPKAHRGRR